MKIIDFDLKFFEYARKWVAKHPKLTEQQVEDSYNIIIGEWINTEADWLDGATPANYFDRFESAQELIELLKGYFKKGINLPEPLYSRIVDMGGEAVPQLAAILRDESEDEALRAECLGMLRDIGTAEVDEYLIDLVCSAEEADELSDFAADVLSGRGAEAGSALLDRYEAAPAYAQMLILDICANFPGDDRTLNYLLHKLRNEPDQRALYASCLGKLGDPRAIDELQRMLNLVDLRYIDYIEIRDAVEALGGEVAEERSFYGDPDFEALRMLDGME